MQRVATGSMRFLHPLGDRTGTVPYPDGAIVSVAVLGEAGAKQLPLPPVDSRRITNESTSATSARTSGSISSAITACPSRCPLSPRPRRRSSRAWLPARRLGHGSSFHSLSGTSVHGRGLTEESLAANPVTSHSAPPWHPARRLSARERSGRPATRCASRPP